MPLLALKGLLYGNLIPNKKNKGLLWDKGLGVWVLGFRGLACSGQPLPRHANNSLSPRHRPQRKMGISQNRGTPFTPQIAKNPPRTPKKGTPFVGNPHINYPVFVMLLPIRGEQLMVHQQKQGGGR